MDPYIIFTMKGILKEDYIGKLSDIMNKINTSKWKIYIEDNNENFLIQIERSNKNNEFNLKKFCSKYIDFLKKTLIPITNFAELKIYDSYDDHLEIFTNSELRRM